MVFKYFPNIHHANIEWYLDYDPGCSFSIAFLGGVLVKARKPNLPFVPLCQNVTMYNIYKIYLNLSKRVFGINCRYYPEIGFPWLEKSRKDMLLIFNFEGVSSGLFKAADLSPLIFRKMSSLRQSITPSWDKSSLTASTVFYGNKYIFRFWMWLNATKFTAKW